MRRTDEDGPVIRIVDDDVIRIVDDGDDVLSDGETLRVNMNVMDDMMVVRRSTFDAADLADHAPGFRTDDAAYLKAYAKYCRDAGLPSERVSDVMGRDARAERSRWIADMTSAWKTDARKRQPDPDEVPDDGDDDDVGAPEGSAGQYLRQFRSRRKIGQTALPFETHADARAGARDAREEYVKSLVDAWRTPPALTGAHPVDAAEPDLGSRPDDPLAPSGVSDPDRALNLEARVERERHRAWSDYRKRLESAWRSPGQAGPGPAGGSR
jgi:hypothetical protein